MDSQDCLKQTHLKNTTGPPVSMRPSQKSTAVFLQPLTWMRPIWPRLIHWKTHYTPVSVEKKPMYFPGPLPLENPLPTPFLPGPQQMDLRKIMPCPIRSRWVLVSGFRLRLRRQSLLFGVMTGASLQIAEIMTHRVHRFPILKLSDLIFITR